LNISATWHSLCAGVRSSVRLCQVWIEPQTVTIPGLQRTTRFARAALRPGHTLELTHLLRLYVLQGRSTGRAIPVRDERSVIATPSRERKLKKGALWLAHARPQPSASQQIGALC
jgi:hypothetical protein